MECTVIKPNTTTYKMRFNAEQDPDMYFRCMWARVTLDHDNFTLSAVTDCGDYTYSWGPTKSESFLDLMCRINADYLLDKISSRSKFDLEESKKSTIENLKLCYDEDEGLLDKINGINEINEGGEEYFFMMADGIIKGDWESIDCIKDYPEGAKVFCRIFKEYLQPVLKANK